MMQEALVPDQNYRRHHRLAWTARWDLDKRVVDGLRLGIGTGRTVKAFIRVLAEAPLPHTVHYFSSSLDTTAALEEIGLVVTPSDEEAHLDLYIDSADQVNSAFEMIKGGGAALTQEKILATMAQEMWCLVDNFKCVENLSDYPIPIEILASAAASIRYQLQKEGWQLRRRLGCLSDQGNPIFWLEKGTIQDARVQEAAWSALPGVVAVGLFARRSADRLYVALDEEQVATYTLGEANFRSPHVKLDRKLFAG